MRIPIILSAVLLLGGCGEEKTAEVPPPQALTREAVGYYCNMIVADHTGPKGQIFLTGREQPLWFTSMRDTLAFTLLPGEPKNIAAAYVNDTGQQSWPVPEPGDWIEARTAWYAVGADVVGGMGAPEDAILASGDDRMTHSMDESNMPMPEMKHKP